MYNIGEVGNWDHFTSAEYFNEPGFIRINCNWINCFLRHFL